MTPLLLLGIALAGGAGAGLRHLADGAARRRWGTGFPVGIALVNISGSLVLGLLTGLAGHVLDDASLLVLGTGLMGGYTTFSTASLDAVRLLLERRALAAALAGLGVLVLTVLAAGLGLAVGRAL